MKKVIAIILCAMLILGLCGWKKIDSENMDAFYSMDIIACMVVG